MSADYLFEDSRLGGANGNCLAAGNNLVIAVPSTNRIAVVNLIAAPQSRYVGDIILPVAPQALATDGTYLYAVGLNVVYQLTLAGPPVLLATTPTFNSYANWLLVANGSVIAPYAKGGVQSIAPGASAPTAILPDLMSRSTFAVANGSRVYVFDQGRARARTLTVAANGSLTETSNDTWLVPNGHTITAAFIDGSTLVVTTDHRILTFSLADPDNPAFAASVTLTQTINSALLLSAGAYYVFTNEGIPAQNESFPYPSLGGAVYQAGVVMVHGTVGSLTLVVAPVSYTGGSSGMPANLFVPAGTNIGTHVKGAAGDAAACCTVGCIGFVQSSGLGGTLTWSAVNASLSLGCIAPDGTVTVYSGGSPSVTFTQFGTYWFYGSQNTSTNDLWGAADATDYAATLTYGAQVLTLALTNVQLSVTTSYPVTHTLHWNPPTTPNGVDTFTYATQGLYSLSGTYAQNIANTTPYTGTMAVSSTTATSLAGVAKTTITWAVTVGFNSSAPAVAPPDPPLLKVATIYPAAAPLSAAAFGTALTGYAVVDSYVYSPTPPPIAPLTEWSIVN